MGQHDNGKRAVGHQGEAWQHGDQDKAGNSQQDQAAGTRYGAQQGGDRDPAGARSPQQEQRGDPAQQQGGNAQPPSGSQDSAPGASGTGASNKVAGDQPASAPKK